MKKYKIQFWYHTDCRAEWIGEARNEVFALTFAYSECLTTCSRKSEEKQWTDLKGFKITIEQI